MKVHELIEILERFDPEYEVVYRDWERSDTEDVVNVYYSDSGKAVIE